MAYHRKNKPEEQEEGHRPPVLLEPTEDGDLVALGEALCAAVMGLLQRHPNLLQSQKGQDQAA